MVGTGPQNVATTSPDVSSLFLPQTTSLGGARLFAGSYDAGITSVRVLSSDDYGFSAGGFRYAGLGGNNGVTNNSAVPEPGEWAAMAMMVTGLGGLVVRARRRRA